MTLSYHIVVAEKKAKKASLSKGAQATSETDHGFNRLGSQ